MNNVQSDVILSVALNETNLGTVSGVSPLDENVNETMCKQLELQPQQIPSGIKNQQIKVPQSFQASLSTPLLPMNKSFAERLLRLRYFATQMQYQLACFNTMGGAYHLCDKPRNALVIAKRQEQLAVQLGSPSLFLRARGFQAINIAMLGDIKKAYRMLRLLIRQANNQNLQDILKFLTSTLLWLSNNRPQMSEEYVPTT